MLHGTGMHDLSSLGVPTLLIAILGVVLLLKWKPALILFITITAALGTMLLAGSLWVSVTQTPWVLLNIPFGVALLIPLTLFVHFWRSSRRVLPHGL
jgi:hypothetical protein